MKEYYADACVVFISQFDPRRLQQPCAAAERPLADSIVVVAQLNEQLRQWYGTPYRYGGTDRGGVDCSGFVYRTFRDRFDMQLPRSTEEQTSLGTKVSRDELMPGDWCSSKPAAVRTACTSAFTIPTTNLSTLRPAAE